MNSKKIIWWIHLVKIINIGIIQSLKTDNECGLFFREVIYQLTRQPSPLPLVDINDTVIGILPVPDCCFTRCKVTPLDRSIIEVGKRACPEPKHHLWRIIPWMVVQKASCLIKPFSPTDHHHPWRSWSSSKQWIVITKIVRVAGNSVSGLCPTSNKQDRRRECSC